MSWRKAFGIGLIVAIVGHLLVISRTISSAVVWAGMIAHFLITGLHGGTGALEGVANIAEIVTNAAFWALLIEGISALIKKGEKLRLNHHP
jgi:hypothetical protein